MINFGKITGIYGKKSPLDTITGHIERITFQNPENGWTVARLQEAGKRDLTTVVGTMTSVQVGETLRCHGTWKNDPNYGPQFLVQDYQVTQPATIRGIEKYLASGMIKGIGKHFAERIVGEYGERTLEVIDESPDLLREIDGIGPKRLEKIKAGWGEQKAIREVMVFLQGYGISPTYAQKVFKTYGDDSIKIIQDNPYQLARDIWGIGFKTADQTAQKLGIAKTSDLRIDAGVEYVLHQLSDDGHTCFPVNQFLEKAQELLEVDANPYGKVVQVQSTADGLRVAETFPRLRGGHRQGNAAFAERDFEFAERKNRACGKVGRGKIEPPTRWKSKACRRQIPFGKSAHHHRRPRHGQEHHHQGHPARDPPADLENHAGRTDRPGRQTPFGNHEDARQHHPHAAGI